MTVVFNTPVCTDALAQLPGIGRKTAQVVTSFAPTLASRRAFDRVVFNHNEGAQSRPLAPYFGVHPVKAIRGNYATQCVAVMSLLVVLMKAPALGRPESQVTQREVEVIDGFLVEPSLITFERKEVVAFLGGDLAGKLALGSYGIDGDGVPSSSSRSSIRPMAAISFCLSRT